MAAWQIPLETKAPPIDPPDAAMGRVLTMQEALQRRQLTQQQVQSAQLQNQERQRALEAEKTLSDLVSQHSQADSSGNASVNRAGVIQGMAKAGYADRGIKWDADQRANEGAAIANAKNKLSNLKEQTDMAAQLLGPIVNSSPDTPVSTLQQMYQDAHQTALQRGLIKPGDEPDTLPLDESGRADLSRLRAHFQGALGANQQVEQLQRNLDYADRLSQHKHEFAKDAPTIAANWNKHATELLGAADNQDQWSAAKNTLKQEGAPDSLLSQFSDTFSTSEQKKAREMAITPEQRAVAEARKQAHDENLDLRQQGFDLRRDLAESSMALRREMAAGRTAGRTANLTPGQLKVEERNISALEDGTATRPGLNAQRLRIGQQLKSGKNAKGETLDDNGREQLQAQLEGLNDNLQNVQYRKAKLYGIQAPDPQDVSAAEDKTEINGQDGSVWTKKGGVAFFTRQGGEAPAAPSRPAAAAPAAAPKVPAPQQQAATAQQSPQVGQRFKNASGQVIKWDGHNYIDEKTGKPFQQ